MGLLYLYLYLYPKYILTLLGFCRNSDLVMYILRVLGSSILVNQPKALVFKNCHLIVSISIYVKKKMTRLEGNLVEVTLWHFFP